MPLTYSDVGRKFKTDPAPSWRWKVRLPELPRAGADDKPSLAATSGFTPIYSLDGLPYTENITFPMDTLGSTKRFGGAMSAPYPNFITTDTASLSFLVDSEYKLVSYIETWRRLVYNPYGMYFMPPDAYRREIWFMAYDIRDDANPRFQGRIIEAWPLGLNAMSFEYDGSTYVKADVTFECRAVEIKVPPVGRGQGGPR